MKSFSYGKAVKVLLANGFALARARGSHEIYKNINDRMVIVAFHGKGKMIPLGTSLTIVKQSGLPKKLFE